MRVVLPVLLSKFEFRLAEPTATLAAEDNASGVVFQLAGILKPRDGLWMHATPRELEKGAAPPGSPVSARL
jgi:hypothetical protein